MKEIKTIRLAGLTNGAHYTLVTNILARAKSDANVTDKASTQVLALEKAIGEEEAATKLSRKSLLTEEIQKADRERGAFFRAYKKGVRTYLVLADNEFAESARILFQHLKDNNINPKAQLDEETGQLITFLEDLEGNYKPQVEQLSLTPFVAQLKTANEKVRSLTLQRTHERMGRQTGAMKRARLSTDRACRALMKWVNALALLTGSADFDSFIEYANTEIIHFKREVLAQRTNADGSQGVSHTEETDDTENTDMRVDFHTDSA